MEIKKKIVSYLQQPVSTKPIVLFRILFGVLMAYHTWVYRNDFFVYAYFIQPDFIFHYPLLEFLGLRVLPAKALFILYKVMFVSACGIALGCLTRTSLLVFLLTFSYTFLLDQTHFNNHYYFIILVAFLLLFLPVQRRWSVDQWASKEPAQAYMPYAGLFLLQAQICLVYFFGGVTKLDPDWINQSVVRYTFLDYPSWSVALITFGGVISDFALSVMLMMPRYRSFAIMWAALFHFSIKFFIDVGVFPFLMMGTLVLFFSFKEKEHSLKKPSFFKLKDRTVWFIGGYLLIQVIIPFRHFLYPGAVSWTKEGDRFAWRMFSQEDIGHVDFFVTDSVTREIIEVPRLKGITLPGYDEMSVHPRMIWQYARFLRGAYAEDGVLDPIVRVDAFVSLNGRPFARLIDPDVNLAEEKYPFYRHADWILPHPDKQESTGVPWYQVGAFFKPGYQLAVIDEKGLLPGEDLRVVIMTDLLRQLAQSYDMKEQDLADQIVMFRQHMWERGGPLLTIRKMLEFMAAHHTLNLENVFQRMEVKYVF